MTATRRLAAFVIAMLPIATNAEPANEKLSKTLTDAGYKFKTLDDGCQEVVLNSKDNWLCYTSISKNGQYAWIEFPCTTIKGTPNADDLKRLLNENNSSATAYFAIGKNGQIRIWKMFPAADLTPERLKDEMQDLRDFALRTEKLWDVTNWRAETVGK